MNASLASLGDIVPLAISGTAEGVRPRVKRDGRLSLVSDSGDLEITVGPEPDSDEDNNFDDNLAETLEYGRLSGLAETLLTDIQADEQSRQGWLDTRSQGLALLGLELQEPRGDTGASTAPLEGMSTVVAPLLLGEVLKAQATARGELLPADGPVRVIDESTYGTGERDELADALEQDFNTYLTRVATEYYPDTDRMLFYTAFGGTGFKKVYHCPIRNRPVSESVDAADLIVNAGATDLANARRITHRIPMRESMVQRMQMVGAYRTVELGTANFMPGAIREREAEIEGILANSQQPHDQNRTIYEVCCEADLGEGPDGLPLPYKVTLDKDSRQILEVRRNWRDGDDLYQPREMYVRFPYIDAIGIYGLGLLHLLGNTSKALTAAQREMLDAGMFACFPGFLYSADASRQVTNEFRIAPGSGMKIETSGGSVKDAVMPLPYKDPSAVLLQFGQWLVTSAKELAGSAELQVGEGQANLPVGTVMAMLDQATKPMSAVHKRLHAAQAKEFQLLADLLREDPESFWAHGRRGIYPWDKRTFIQALDSFELAPVSDPNDPTRTHRLMKAQALKMLSSMSPQLYNAEAVDSHILRLLGFSNPQQFFAPPQAAAPDPQLQLAQMKMAEAQMSIAAKGQETKAKMAIERMKADQDAQDRQSKEQIEQAKLGVERQKIGAQMATDGIGGLHDVAAAHAQMASAAADRTHDATMAAVKQDQGGVGAQL